MRKKLISMLFAMFWGLMLFAIFCGQAFAGPGHVVTYPVLHSKKTVHGVKRAGHGAKRAGRGLGRAAKAFIW